jgi:hypothetical protein
MWLAGRPNFPTRGTLYNILRMHTPKARYILTAHQLEASRQLRSMLAHMTDSPCRQMQGPRQKRGELGANAYPPVTLHAPQNPMDGRLSH